jgi:hypothetical protein
MSARDRVVAAVMGRRSPAALAMEAPRVSVSIDRPVPGHLVRLAPGLLVLVCAAVMAAGRVGAVVGVVLAALVIWRPAWPIPAVTSLLVGLWVFAQGDLLTGQTRNGRDGLLTVAVLVLVLHLLLRTTSLAARVSWRGVVETLVLSRVLRSVLGAQLVAQALVLVVVWLRAGLGGAVAGQGWLRAVAVVAAVAVAVLVVPRDWLVRVRPPSR